MKKFLTGLLAALIISLPCVAKEKMLYTIDSGFYLASNLSQKGNLFLEFVPTDETVKNWTEMITIQQYDGLQNKTTPKLFVSNFLVMIKQSDDSLTYKVIKADENDIIVEWALKGTLLVDAQTEILRVIGGKDAMNVVHYVIKKSEITQEQEEKMIAFVKSVTLSEEEDTKKKK